MVFKRYLFVPSVHCFVVPLADFSHFPSSFIEDGQNGVHTFARITLPGNLPGIDYGQLAEVGTLDFAAGSTRPDPRSSSELSSVRTPTCGPISSPTSFSMDTSRRLLPSQRKCELSPFFAPVFVALTSPSLPDFAEPFRMPRELELLACVSFSLLTPSFYQVVPRKHPSGPLHRRAVRHVPSCLPRWSPLILLLPSHRSDYFTKYEWAAQYGDHKGQ
jgi:hypothetical protein